MRAAVCAVASVSRSDSYRESGSGHGPAMRRVSWNCDQISSVTCGITGWRIASSRSSAANALLAESGLDRLEVPVAEVVERQVVEAIDGMCEVEPVEVGLDLGARRVD